MNLYAYVGNNSVMFVDLIGLAAKELQQDIDNKNIFVIQLVARGLNQDLKGVEDYLLHTFIDVMSYNVNGDKNHYTIGGYNNTDTGELDGQINNDDNLYWSGKIADTKTIVTPKGMESYQFAQNILNEFHEYEKKQKSYWISGAVTNNSNYGNCNNYSTTILTNACGGSFDTIDNVNNFDPTGINFGMGTNFEEKKKKETLSNQFIKGYSELEYYIFNINRAF